MKNHITHFQYVYGDDFTIMKSNAGAKSIVLESKISEESRKETKKYKQNSNIPK